MATAVLTDPPERVEVAPDARDRRAAEMRFAGAVGQKPATPQETLIRGYPELWQAWVAWHAATRTGVWSGTWEDWSARLIEVEDSEVAGLPDPTSAAPSAA